MQKTNSIFHSPNLNNLPFLAALIEHGSITQAGLALGLSQPAASRIMAQLRKQIGDPILVRTRHGYQLTEYAIALGPSIKTAMELTQGVFKAKSFEPITDSRTLKMATTDFGLLTVMLALNGRVQNHAPHVSVDTQGWDAQTLSQLEQGQIDMALFNEGKLPVDCHRQFLFKETYHLVCRDDHPLCSTRDKKDILKIASQYPRITFNYPTGNGISCDDVLERAGLGAPMSRHSSPYFQGALWMLPNTDSVMAVPSRIFHMFKTQLGLVGWELNSLSEVYQEHFEYYLVWHHRSHEDPFHIWIRQQLKEVDFSLP
ncbi:MAG: LysR family transcriptional regulator [Bermanella sp.]